MAGKKESTTPRLEKMDKAQDQNKMSKGDDKVTGSFRSKGGSKKGGK